jgi:GNAT superfamily N-acetyltransferase
LKVWRADTAEAEDVARLIAEFGKWWGKNVVPEAEVRASVERIMGGDDGEYLLGAVDGAPVGVCQLRFRWSVWKSAEDCWLEDLFVRESARGRGIGKALLAHLASLAVERGYGRVEWAVLDWNEPAITFYRSLGATLMDDWRICRLTGGALDALAGAEPTAR